MSKYTTKFKYIIEFEGDVINISSTRLKRKDFLKLAPYIDVGADGEVTMSFLQQNEFADVCADLIPKYVTAFSGLKDDMGEDIKLTVVLEETYFMDVVSKMLENLFASAGISKKGDLKNLDAPLMDGSTELSQTE